MTAFASRPLAVAVTDFIEQNLEWENEALSGSGIEFRAHQLKQASLPELVAAVRDAEILVVNMVKMDRAVLASLPNCRLIIRHGAGYDNIDVDAATEYGIQVCYVPDYCREEVAEQAMMLILACHRRFAQQQQSFEESVRKGIWDFSSVIPIHRLSHRTAGIIGCGRIGSIVLQMLRGFNMNVLVCDPYLSAARQQELGIETMELDHVLSHSDVITMHPSLNKSTYHCIGERELRLMKPTAILVNTARGSIVDAESLAKACREGWIAGAGIDVFEKEPPQMDFILRGIQNIILTPHLAWYSEDAGWSIREKIVEDIRRYTDGRPPRYPINTIKKRDL